MSSPKRAGCWPRRRQAAQGHGLAGRQRLADHEHLTHDDHERAPTTATSTRPRPRRAHSPRRAFALDERLARRRRDAERRRLVARTLVDRHPAPGCRREAAPRHPAPAGDRLGDAAHRGRHGRRSARARRTRRARRPPLALRRQVLGAGATDTSIRIYTAGGLTVEFGGAARLTAKVIALKAVLGRYHARGVTCTFVDVSVPDRPLAAPVLSSGVTQSVGGTTPTPGVSPGTSSTSPTPSASGSPTSTP